MDSTMSKSDQIYISFFSLCRKANSLFEKNAAPLLHLAGMEIKIVKVFILYISLGNIIFLYVIMAIKNYYCFLVYLICGFSLTDRL